MIRQAKGLLQNISFSKTRNLTFYNNTSFFFVPSYNFSETNNIPNPEKEQALSKIKKQFIDADKYIRKRKNLDEAIKIYQEILYSFNITQEAKAKQCLAALIGIGNVLVLQKRIDRALGYYLLALAFHPENKYEFQRGILYKQIAECYFGIAEYENASEYFNKALALFKDSNNEDCTQIGQIKLYIGRLYAKNGDFSQAAKNYKEAEKIFPKYIENDYFILKAKTQLAKTYFWCKDKKSAKISIKEAISLYDKAQGLKLQQKIEITKEIIKALKILQIREGIIEKYKTLVELIYEDDPNSKNIPITLMNLGEQYIELYDRPKIKEIYLRALEEAERLGLEELKGKIYLNLGICYWTLQDTNHAIDVINNSIEKNKEYYKYENADVGKAYYYLGRIYFEEWDLDKSEKLFVTALKILSENGSEDEHVYARCQEYLYKVRDYLREADNYK